MPSRRTARRNRRTARRTRSRSRRFPPYGPRRRQRGGATLAELIAEVQNQLEHHPDDSWNVKNWLYQQAYDGTWSIRNEDSMDLNVHPNLKTAVWNLYSFIQGQGENMNSQQNSIERLSNANLL